MATATMGGCEGAAREALCALVFDIMVELRDVEGDHKV